MAQPPLSVAIRQLEQELGTSLFERSSHEVTLTDAGSAFLPGARRTLAEAEAAVVAARRAGSGQVGSLRVGHNWSSRFETLPALGQAFASRYPEVELLTEEMRPNQMPASLRSGSIDVALALYPDIVGELSYRLVRKEPVVAVLSTDHPHADEETIGLASLADEFLLFPRELAPRLHDYYVNLCRRAGFEPRLGGDSSRTRWTIGTWDASTTGLFPQSVAKELPDGVVAVQIDEPPGILETYVLWRAIDQRPTVEAFVEVSTAVFTPATAQPAGR